MIHHHTVQDTIEDHQEAGADHHIHHIPHHIHIPQTGAEDHQSDHQ